MLHQKIYIFISINLFKTENLKKQLTVIHLVVCSATCQKIDKYVDCFQSITKSLQKLCFDEPPR